MDHELELSSAKMRDLVAKAMDRIVRHIETLPSQPMHHTGGSKKLARSLAEPMPETGAPFEDLLALLFDRIVPRSFNTASPGYLAYIPGGGLFHAAVADLIALSTNRYAGVFIAAPGLVQLETNVLRWFGEMLGLPSSSGGVLTTGGSLANLIAIVTARRERLPADFLRGTIYASTEVHHSVLKAAILAGFSPDRVRAIETDERYRVSVPAMADAIARDRAAGELPFLIVASAGTTATGAVDDLAALADLRDRENLWMHVDAAYGGFFALTERGRATLAGIERADSITLDPHKSLFLPYGTGCLLVRDKESLRRAHAVAASYLPPMQTDEGFDDFCDLSPELSRDARGLRVWLPLKMHGAGAFRRALDEKLDLARFAASELAKDPRIEILAEPQLSLFAFRARPKNLEGADLDRYTKDLCSRVNQRQRVFITGAVTKGSFVARMCVLSFRTHEDRVRQGIEDVFASLAELESTLGAPPPNPGRGA